MKTSTGHGWRRRIEFLSFPIIFNVNSGINNCKPGNSLMRNVLTGTVSIFIKMLFDRSSGAVTIFGKWLFYGF